MKRNKKMSKRMSVTAAASFRFGTVLVLFFVMVILNVLSSSSRNQLLQTKGNLERQLAKLEEARMRESTHWEGMKVPDNIERALLKHGLKMIVPRADQTVRMDRNGIPLAGQYSLVKARQRGVLTERQVKYRDPKRRKEIH